MIRTRVKQHGRIGRTLTDVGSAALALVGFGCATAPLVENLPKPAPLAAPAQKCPPTQVTISPDNVDLTGLDKDGRQEVIYDVLGRIFGAKPLFELLNQPDPQARIEILIGIANHSHRHNGDYIHPKAIEALAHVVREDQSPEVRKVAIQILGSIARDGGEIRYRERHWAEYALSQSLSDPDQETRFYAAWGVAHFYINGNQIGDGWLGESVSDLLRSEDPQVRLGVYNAVSSSDKLHPGEGRQPSKELTGELSSVLSAGTESDSKLEQARTSAIQSISG